MTKSKSYVRLNITETDFYKRMSNANQRTLTMFVGVGALSYQHHTYSHTFITGCRNFHKPSQSLLIKGLPV